MSNIGIKLIFETSCFMLFERFFTVLYGNLVEFYGTTGKCRRPVLFFCNDAFSISFLEWRERNL